LNNESGLNIGYGDDYQLYSGVDDPRFVLVPYDLDTLMQQGLPVGSINGSIFTYRNVAGFSRMLNHPEIVQRYYQAFFDLFDTLWNSETINPLLDQILGDFVPSSNIDAMKQLVIDRKNAVLLQIPRDFSISSSLPVSNGYDYSTTDTVALTGTADTVYTRSILVNDQTAVWSPADNAWSVGGETESSGPVETLVNVDSVWKYLDDGSNQGTAWRALAFSDAGWASGAAELGYGDGDETTVVSYGSDSSNKYTTTYFRQNFTVTNTSELSSLTLHLLRDDGAVVYLNNQEIVRSNMPDGTIEYNTFASSALSDPEESTYYTYYLSPTLLNEGENILAVEIHQGDLTSSDISFNLDLKAVRGSSEPVSGIHLNPGINRIDVRMFDGPSGTGSQIEYHYIDVWYDDGSVSTLSGTIGNMTLDAASGPWQITGDVTVPAGVTLTIEPGTTLYFTSGTSVTVNGRINAQGTEYQRIRLTRQPGDTSTWNGIHLNETTENNVLSYVDLEYADTSDGSISMTNSVVLIENMSFAGSERTVIKSTNSSAIIRNSVFADILASYDLYAVNVAEQIVASTIPAGGYFIIENNLFGTTTGHNDVIDFSSLSRPNPIPQILNNTFMGTGDEMLDLGGDAYISGNLFVHEHKDEYNIDPTGESNCISTGDNISGDATIMVVRNVFYDVDHAVNLKNNTYGYFENNVVLNVADGGSAIKMVDLGSGKPAGKGAYVDGCIFSDLPIVFENVDLQQDGSSITTDLVMNNSLVSPDRCSDEVSLRLGNIMGLGTGNICGEPHFVDIPNDFSLRSGPGLGTGPNGLDMGYAVPAWASISGEPPVVTYQTSATLTVSGPGITDYKYRVNGGTWSDQQSVAVPVTLSGLSNGTYTVEVIGLNYAGVWQDETAATVSETWTVNTSHARIIINEILAHTHGSDPDIIELYNDSPTAVSIAGMSLTDDPDAPTKFVIPAGTTLPAEGYKVYYGAVEQPTPDYLGFALSAEGEGLYLYNSSHTLVDSIEFGLQINNVSIGRLRDDQWHATVPTFGQANIPQETGDPRNLKINEWLANEQTLFTDDFIELYNADDLPVELSGFYITDDPVARPNKHQIAPLTFIAANGYGVFIADDDENEGPNHLNFNLSATQEMIGLYDTELSEIDKVIYLGQTADVSQGRLPDGADTLDYFDLPTPGLSNGSMVEIVTTTLIPEAASKQVLIPTYDIGTAWRTDLNYDTTGWISGIGGVGYEDSTGYESYFNIDVSAMYNVNETCYIRIPFTLAEDPANFDSLTLKMRYDDAFIVYLNGQEVLRSDYAPTTPVWNSGATYSSEEATDFVDFDITAGLSNLQTGDNLLAIHGLNYLLTSSDFLISAELEGEVDITTEDPSYAMAEAILNDLRITELMYNPLNGNNILYDNDDYEFVELRNIGTSTLELEGVRFINGIDFTFPAYSLAAGDYVVAVKNQAAFQSRYGTGIPIAGVYDSSLSNGGEQIILQLPAPFDAAVLRFDYIDTWYPATDGGGYSLVIVDPWANRSAWDDSDNWRQSSQVNGSPGTDD